MFSIGKGKKMLQNVSLKSLSIAMAILVVMVATTICLFGFAMTKQIVIHDGEEVIEVTTTKQTAGEVLAEKGITTREEDIVSIPLDQKLKNKDEIVIERAKRVFVIVDGGVTDHYSCADTIKAFLNEKGIELGEYDEVTPALETALSEGLYVLIDRVRVDILDFEVEVPYETKRVPVSSQPKEYAKVTQEGQNGRKKVTYKNVIKNGKEISSEIVAEEIIVEPVEMVEEYGTMEPVRTLSGSTVSRGGLNYRKVLQVTATAYDASPASNGVYAGKTATGRTPTYGVVAVDPSVIPLNTRLYIESSDGGQSWVYGYAVAGDTGGAIKGNKIDLCFDSSSEVYAFGRRSATVYILD